MTQPSLIQLGSEKIRTFLSISIRAEDQPLVEATARFLEGNGFACKTVGRNVSRAEQVDDAIKSVLGPCEAFVALATERLIVREHHHPSDEATHPPSYLLQETAMAFERGLPILVLKTPRVTLPAVMSRNIHLAIKDVVGQTGCLTFPAGVTKHLVSSHLDDLRSKALAIRNSRRLDAVKRGVGWMSALALGSAGAWKLANVAGRPDCFGTFYYKDSQCKHCSYREDCKVQKRNNGE